MLDSTGHVYMTDPNQQEMENDYYARFDAQRERFSSEDDFCDEPSAEEMEEYLDSRPTIEPSVTYLEPSGCNPHVADDDVPF